MNERLEAGLSQKTACKVNETAFLLPSPEKLTKDKIRLKGPVLRFKPTFAKQGLFIDRYLELTGSMLKYYGRALGSAAGQDPLFRIPVSQISKVCWIDTANWSKTEIDLQKEVQSKLARNETVQEERGTICFEVHLESDYENLHMLNSLNESLFLKRPRTS